VTQAQWKSVMGTSPSRSTGSDLPVEQVSWNDCMEFCTKLTKSEHASGALPRDWKYTLPTEAQWEYACRAGTTTKYSFGDSGTQLGQYGWFDNNSGSKTHAVGSKKPNLWGFKDMHGNVWEWCLDWYGDYPSSSVSNPSGPSSGSDRVIRGGSWYGTAAYLRSAVRGIRSPGNRSLSVGLRLARVTTK